MTIKATRPGSGATHPNTHDEYSSIWQRHYDAAKAAGHMFPSDAAFHGAAEEQRLARLAAMPAPAPGPETWDRAEASFPPHLRHGHVDEFY